MAEPSRLADAVEYFRRRPFGRILQALRERYEALGRVGGRVQLTLNEEERLALRDFLGMLAGRRRASHTAWAPRGAATGGVGVAGSVSGSGATGPAEAGAAPQEPGRPEPTQSMQPTQAPVLTLELARFDRALRASRFGCTLPELLQAYFGTPIVTRPAWRQARTLEWQRLLDDVEQEANRLGDPVALRWWAAVRNGQAPRSQAWLRRAFEGSSGGALESAGGSMRLSGSAAGACDGSAADVCDGSVAGVCDGSASTGGGGCLRETVRTVLKALASLSGPRGRQETLPVFAAALTGDPHAFDPDRAAGRLLERALADLLPEVAFEGSGLYSPAMRREAVLAAAGLARDDLSSAVLVAHLRAATLADGRPDPLVAGAREAAVPVAYPLRTIRRWSTVGSSERVFVVENPSVFGLLAQSFAVPGAPTLVCTAGQPSLAAYALLDRLAEAGAAIHYSGDFDLPGILIARALKMRYGHRLRLWRMEPGDYQQALARAVSAPSLTAREKRQLASLVADPAAAVSDLRPLLETLLRVGRKAFQENLLPELESDVAGAVR